MLNCRFYLGKANDNQEEFPGQNEAIQSEELYQRVQGRKKTRPITRTVVGPKGLLQGMIACGQ
jgi:hypothetical protein